MPYLRVCARTFVLALLPLTACAPSLSTMQPAHVVGKGGWRAVGGIEAGAPLGVLDDLVDRGKTLASAAANGRALTDAEKLAIIDAGVGLFSAGPLGAPLVGVTYGVLERIEVDARYAGSGLRLGARGQVVDRATGPFDLTLGIGIARAVTEIPLADSLPGVSADDPTRHTLDASALVGTSRDFWRVWAGPRLAWSWFDGGLGLALPNEAALRASFDARASYFGGQAGLALGYRRLFVAFELTITRMSGRADMGPIGTLAPMGRRVDLEATIVQPSFAVMGEL